MSSREISESAFEYLLSEILSVLNATSTTEDQMVLKLERMGYDIGFRYIEKIVSQTKTLGTDPLDLVKFICKDFWEELFKKKVAYIKWYDNSILFRISYFRSTNYKPIIVEYSFFRILSFFGLIVTHLTIVC